MSTGRLRLVVGLACTAVLTSTQTLHAQEDRVVDQLLNILRQNKQISDQQYRALKQKAEDERQQDLHKAAALPPPTPSASPAVVAVAPPPPTPAPDSFRAYFKNGFVLESADGNFRFAPNVLTQVDWNVSDPSSPVKDVFHLDGTSTGVEFRRARLGFTGLVFGNIDFKFEYDFAQNSGGQPAFKDVYMGMNKIPFVQYIRVGYFKEPFSLDEQIPDTYTTFMERALPNAFAQPDRNTGFAVYQNYFDQRMLFAAGGFRLTNNFGNGFGSDSPYDVTARVTGLPMYEIGENLIHLGFSYSHKFRHYSPDSQETLAYASRPESHLFPVNLVNTGNVNTNGADLLDPEIAWVHGPFSAQGEYMWTLVDQSNLQCSGSPPKCTTVGLSNPSFGGGYIEFSYFLTGESRSSFYDVRKGAFDRVVPINSFTIDGTHWGAWQVAARYSYLNLDSAKVHGGALDDITAGVNWYLNGVTRISVNYIWAHRESVGDSNIVQGRFQLAF